MTNVWVRPLNYADKDERRMFIEWLHAGRAENRYDPKTFEIGPDGKFLWCEVLTFFNSDGIVGFLPMTRAYKLESMAFRPGIEPTEEAKALQAMQHYLVGKAFSERFPDAFFVTTDERVVNFALRYGWVTPDVPLLHLSIQSLEPKKPEP